MFDELMIREGSVRNLLAEDGTATGFAFECHVPYYRGIGLSMVEDPELVVDGKAIPLESLRFTYRGVTRTFEELSDLSDVRWELGESATISALVPGGLGDGRHELDLILRLRVSYLPFIAEHRFTREIVL